MAKAKKLPSGAWRTQVYSHTENGKKIYESFTADTKAESEFLAAQFRQNKTTQRLKGRNMTVGQAIDLYIEKHPTLSPTTIETYKKHRRVAFQHIINTPIKALTNEKMNDAIIVESCRKSAKNGTVSAKTVCAEYGTISTAIKYASDITFKVNLPEIPRQFVELPEVEKVISMIKGTSIELPCMLAIWLSFSMSEIRGLKCSSVRNGKIYIDQVVVDIGGKPVEKTLAKEQMRRRVEAVPEYIMSLIEQQPTYQDYVKLQKNSYLIPLNANQIGHRFSRLAEKNNLNISFHKLRHMNASVMALLGIPETYAMDRGGWSTPHTMRKVYTHTFTKERKKVDKIIDKYFEKFL